MHILPLSHKMFIMYLPNLISIVPVSSIMIGFSVAPSIIENMDWKCLTTATALYASSFNSENIDVTLGHVLRDE